MNALLNPITWLLPIAAALVALVVSEVRPVWLDKWYSFLLWIENRGPRYRLVPYPLGACTKCTAGFWCLVASVFHEPNAFVAHITSASLAIVLGASLEVYYKWTQKQ